MYEFIFKKISSCEYLKTTILELTEFCFIQIDFILRAQLLLDLKKIAAEIRTSLVHIKRFTR